MKQVFASMLQINPILKYCVGGLPNKATVLRQLFQVKREKTSSSLLQKI